MYVESEVGEATADGFQLRDQQQFHDCYYKAFLPLLASSISPDRLPKVDLPTLPSYELDTQSDSHKITAKWFWGEISSFLRPHDVVFGDTGTTLFGLQDTTFPDKLW